MVPEVDMNRHFAALLGGLLATAAYAAQTPSPLGAQVYLIDPVEGQTVKSPFLVRFGLTPAMGVAPAGVNVPRTGHHHLLIDTKLTATDQPIPNDAHHLHFGGGQTETTLKLAPGNHTLQLILGDHLHVPHNPPVASKVVNIVVQ
jgi:hypothetical protein